MTSEQHLTPAAWWPSAAQQWPREDQERLARLAPDRIPHHVAIIMDGNGRWAKQHGFRNRNRGHREGLESVRAITRTCAEMKLTALTLYAFSTENWRRPSREVGFLMSLLGRFLRSERGLMMENNIRFQTIGVREALPSGAQAALEETTNLTAGNTGMVLNIALNYGGRDEILRATTRAAHLVQQGRLHPEQIDEAFFSNLLDTAGLPDPDLLIRTSGELRISNFLLWQIAYTELVVTPVLWPDFRRPQLLDALEEFGRRERRFGGVKAASSVKGASWS